MKSLQSLVKASLNTHHYILIRNADRNRFPVSPFFVSNSLSNFIGSHRSQGIRFRRFRDLLMFPASHMDAVTHYRVLRIKKFCTTTIPIFLWNWLVAQPLLLVVFPFVSHRFVIIYSYLSWKQEQSNQNSSIDITSIYLCV